MILTPRHTCRAARRILLFSTFGLVAVACGGDDEAPTGSASDDESDLVVSTTSVWADITSQVACGQSVASVIPAGADPHSYEPSLRDRELVSNAAVVIANGAGLEATTADLLAAAIDDGVNVVEVATHIDLLDGDHDDEHTDDDHTDDRDDDHDDDDEHTDDDHTDDRDDDHAGDHDDEHADDDHTEADHDDDHAGDEHEHGEGDPHVWHDPTRVAGALDVIASALAAAGIETCESAYHDELLALDAEIGEILSAVPAADRVLVTSHGSLAYFADRYDFEVVGTVIPSTSTMAESSAGELAALAELVEQHSVRAIFTDAFESASDAEALADRIGIPVVPLVTDAVTDDAPTYAELMRSNATTIADALSP